MPHYRTGTVNVTNGSLSVVGVGTDFIAGAAIGECLAAPDGKLYEIASIQSATTLTLGTGYLGATVTGQAYSIIPTQSYIRDLALQAATLVNGYQSIVGGPGSGKFDDGTVGSPGIQFAADANTGIRRTGTDAVAVVTGGVDRITVSSAGAVVVPGAVTVNGALLTTSTARMPGLSIGADTDVYLYESATNTLTIRAGDVGTEKYTNFAADGTLAVLNGGITTAGNSALGDAEASDTHAIKGATTLLANSASAALTVTQTGAGNAFVVEDSASTDSTPFSISASGNVVIGATAAYGVNSSTPPFTVAIGDIHAASFTRWTNNAFPPAIYLAKTRSTTVGTFGTIVQSGDGLGTLEFVADDGTATTKTAAAIEAFVDGTPGTNDMPGRLVFSTTADGASSPTERMRIDSAGLITARNSTGLGYGAGSGGTVTQATSKSTAVSLNKPSGQITTTADALAAGASVAFLLTNTAIALEDTVLLSVQITTSYLVQTTGFITNGVYVRLTNRTAGPLSEAVVINFAVIKGSTS